LIIRGLGSHRQGIRVRSLGLGKQQESWLIGSLVVLPYASYLGLAGLAIHLLSWLVRYPQAISQRLVRQGWIGLILGLAISIAVAQDPALALLQSTNFWPFFFFFAGLSTYITHLPSPLASLERWAFWLLMGSIPINLRAFLEYLPALAWRLGISGWPWEAVPVHQRVDSVFGNPNVLAAYLVIIFGLGLGLCLRTRSSPPSPANAWIYGAMGLIPLGVFCAGSRSGVVVLLIQLLIAMAMLRRHRWAVWGGLGLATATLTSVVIGGVGGRSLTEALTSSSLRVAIWQISLPLIRQYPWIGTGFGGFQSNYVPYAIPDEAVLAHAHNLWLNLAAEAGIPVIILLTSIVGWICYRAAQTYRLGRLPPETQPLLIGYGLGFLACTLFALFDIAFFDARVNVLGWLMLAALQAISDLANVSGSISPSPQGHDKPSPLV
jgi:hypothetical protein